MFRLFFICICIILHSTHVVTLDTLIVSKSTTQTFINTTNPPLPTSTAKLVRFRRQPPVTIIKHIIRSSKNTIPRRRFKRPKIKFGLPSFSEPITFYKPRSTIQLAEKPLFDHSHHLNIEDSNIDRPVPSFESHTMNLDFYSHGDNSYADGFDLESKVPSYSLTTSNTEKSLTRSPHSIYGVPKKYSNTDSFDTNSKYYASDESSNYSQPYIFSEGSYIQPTSNLNKNSFFHHDSLNQHNQPYFKTTPTVHNSDTYPVINPDNYPLYDKTIHNSGFSSHSGRKNFGEPPSPNTDIEITYSSSNEISLPSPNYNHQESGNYNYQQIGNFAEPPVQPPHLHHEEDYAEPADPSVFQPTLQGDQLPTSEELPINNNNKELYYNFPKSSYEVPIYNAIPFDASNNQEQEFYPPHLHKTAKDNSLGKDRKRIRVHGNKINNTTKHTLDVPELMKAFEAETRYKNQEYSADTDANQSNNVEKEQSFIYYITSTAAPTRVNGNYISHDWNPMRFKASVRIFPTPNTTSILSEKIAIVSRSKIKERTQFRPQLRLLPTTTTTTTSSIVLPNLTTINTNSQQVDVISIEKSRSKSYYDGTITTPTLTMSNLYKSRLNRFKMPTHTTTKTTNENKFTLQPTTKGLYDTTYFKISHNEEIIPSQKELTLINVPKNHKTF